MYYLNSKHKKVGVTISESDKRDLKKKNIPIDKEEYFIMIKGTIRRDNNYKYACT